VIEITGYPAAPNEIAPPTPALALVKGKHGGQVVFLSAAIGSRLQLCNKP
jgi:hypothetical protein